VDLPTYTNIWRIEKRLYKLYDFRLPMPLPINWIAVFAGITIPYVVLLVAIGLPFDHSLVALYILPPGLLTWLTTRPVIEGKRLPELVESQVRYLTEPRTWVRLAPLSEKDKVVVTARVWHSRPPRKAAPAQAPKAKPTAKPAVAAGSKATTARGKVAARGAASRATVAAGTVAAGTVAAGTVAAGTVAVGALATAAKPGPATVPVRAGAQRPRPANPAPAKPNPAPAEPNPAPAEPKSEPAKPKLAMLGLGRTRPAPELPPTRAPQRNARPAQAGSTAGPGSATTPAPAKQPPAPPARPTANGQQEADAVPLRVRGGAPDAASLEVSHDGPRRSAPPASSVPQAPASPITPWPGPVSPFRESRPVGPAPDDSQPSAAPLAPLAPVATPTPEPTPTSTPEPTPTPEPAPPPTPTPAPVAATAEAQATHEDAAAATAASAASAAVTETQNHPTVSVERARSGPARDRNLSWHGKVKIVTGAGATAGPGARDQEALDRNRARLPLAEPKRILVLGCTSGAGQTVTALMTAAMLASLREHPVAAVDLHDGALARYREPAAALRDLLAGKPPLPVTAARADGLHPTPKPNPGRLDVIAGGGRLADGDEIKLAVQLNRHYPLTVLDPGAAGLTKLLKVTDQLVIVAPASADAAGALADTREWLDNNGHADLATRSVTVINGASRRSLADVEQAESIARGRSRAIVRVPWDDMLPRSGPSELRPQTRVAYTALAGVLVAGMAAAGMRRKS